MNKRYLDWQEAENAVLEFAREKGQKLDGMPIASEVAGRDDIVVFLALIEDGTPAGLDVLNATAKNKEGKITTKMVFGWHGLQFGGARQEEHALYFNVSAKGLIIKELKVLFEDLGLND